MSRRTESSRPRRLLDDRYATLALRLATVMALYTLVRVVFYVANRDLFGDVTGPELRRALAGGLVFDASAVCYTNLLVIVLSLVPLHGRAVPALERVAKWIFVTVNAVALAADLADVGYYRFTLRRTTSSVFSEFGHEQHLGTLLSRIVLDYWPVALLWAAMVAVLVLVWGRRPTVDPLRTLRARAYYPAASLALLVAVFFAVVAGRGGFFTRHHRPITNSNAGAWVDKPSHVALVLNTPFSIMRTLRQPALERVHWYPDEQALARVYDPVHAPEPAIVPGRPNVVVIILESFGAEHIGALNRGLEGGTYEGFTPFLDSLMGRSLTFANAFANGRKTIDAMPSVTASIPSLVEPFILSHYSANSVNSVASVLKRRGYETLFFHGAPNGSMGFQAFVKLAGYDRYFGMSEYGNDADYDGVWGIWDEEFFQFFARKLGEQKEPFLATLFSLSSHHPYQVPARYRGKLKKGRMHVEECINYSDHALARLFETASAMPWYRNTIFVVTADHGSAQNRPEYQAMVGRFRIPLLFFRPDDTLHGWDERPAQQLDVMPTLLHLVGADEPFVAFGNDLLAPDGPRFAINYADGTFQLIEGDHVLHWDGKRTVGLFDYRRDPLLQHDLAAQEPALRARLEGLVEAVVQQFNGRMLDNRLTAAPQPSAMLQH